MLFIFKICRMEQIHLDIGKRIREIRQSKNLTQQQLANILESDISTVNRIELGKTNARLSSIIALSRALEVSLYDIFKGSEMELYFDTEEFKSHNLH